MAKKAGLGRGLGALISEANAESGNTPETTLSIEKIHRNPDQPRKTFDQTALEELSDSIRQNGVLQPILVRKKGSGYEIVAGERRYQASKLAGLKEIPVVIKRLMMPRYSSWHSLRICNERILRRSRRPRAIASSWILRG